MMMHRSPGVPASSAGRSMLFRGDSPQLRGGSFLSQGRGPAGTPGRSAYRSMGRASVHMGMREYGGVGSAGRSSIGRSSMFGGGGYGGMSGGRDRGANLNAGAGGLSSTPYGTPRGPPSRASADPYSAMGTPYGGASGAASGGLLRQRSVVGAGMSDALPSTVRQRARSPAPPVSDAPPTASYDDDVDDEAAALLEAVDDDLASPTGTRSNSFLFDRTPQGRRGMASMTGAGAPTPYKGSALGDNLFSPPSRAALTAPVDTLFDGRTANCWVTAFGFRPGMSDAVLRHFQSYGTIVNQKVSNSNWLHIQYETADQANKALGANGRKHDGYMLGVVPCTESELSGTQSAAPTGGHHRLAKRTSALASTQLDSESIFKPRPRRRNICSRLCEYLFKSSW